MKTLWSMCWAALLTMTGGYAFAGAAEVTRVLEQHRQHGYESPALAVEQLLSVSQGMDIAPLELRMRYRNALAMLYVGMENTPQVKVQLAELDRMARAERCQPCAQYKIVREIQHALRMQDAKTAQALLAALGPPPANDKDMQQAIHYMRAGVLDSTGNHVRAIDEGMAAARLAVETNNPAEQVRALNMLMLANIARRDLDRASSLAREAYALAERMGFIYMLTYIRGNESWIFSLKGDRVNQLRALNEVLAITRKYTGMADSELIALVNLAEYHVKARQWDQAVELSKEAIALADKANKPTAKGVVMSSLGLAQVALGEADKGIATIEEGRAMLVKSGAKSYVSDVTLVLAEAYELAGRYQPALDTLRKYVAMTEEANASAREKAVAEAQAKFSGERKDHEIQRLSLENAKRQAEIAARGWQQRLWATAALALALGAALLIQMVSRARRRNRLLEDSNAVLSDQSVHDPLTGVFNRRHCAELMAQQELTLAKSRDRNYKGCVGLLLLDVDHFKHINDTYGHAAGDTVLVEIARRLQQLVRQHDVVVRWGGEEFVLVLPGTSPEGMQVLAERVLRVIAEAPVQGAEASIRVTVSAGCVCYPLLPGQPWQDSLKVADLAMYMAKQGGRNRAVVVASVAEGAQAEIILTNLAGAAQAGMVALHTVAGPVPAAEHEMMVAI